MSRLVDAAPPGVTAFSGQSRDKATKDYAERVAKYVPAEVIAAYLALVPLVIGTTEADTDLRDGLLLLVLVGCTIFTPLYLNRLAESGRPKRLHLIVATIAFVIWSYSIGGFFTEVDLYHEAIAGITVAFYTLGAGLLVPTQGTA
jgi:hypothetical protein